MSSFEDSSNTNLNTDDEVKEPCDIVTENYIPLSFWMGGNLSNDHFNTTKTKVLKKIDDIVNSIDLNSNDPEYYSNIEYSILECRYELQRACKIIWPLPNYFQNELDFLNSNIRGKIIPEKFYTPLIMTKLEEINEFKLYDCEKNIMDWFTFIELSKLYKNSKVYCREDFFEKCSNTCCSDWAKQDRNGECFGGFWITDKENAWELTRQDNFEGLYMLPFPHDLIFRTIDIGCGNRMESVRYSNFLCYWIEQKMKQIGMI